MIPESAAQTASMPGAQVCFTNLWPDEHMTTRQRQTQPSKTGSDHRAAQTGRIHSGPAVPGAGVRYACCPARTEKSAVGSRGFGGGVCLGNCRIAYIYVRSTRLCSACSHDGTMFCNGGIDFQNCRTDMSRQRAVCSDGPSSRCDKDLSQHGRAGAAPRCSSVSLICGDRDPIYDGPASPLACGTLHTSATLDFTHKIMRTDMMSCACVLSVRTGPCVVQSAGSRAAELPGCRSAQFWTLDNMWAAADWTTRLP